MDVQQVGFSIVIVIAMYGFLRGLVGAIMEEKEELAEIAICGITIGILMLLMVNQ